jgi:hypothetical protein
MKKLIFCTAMLATTLISFAQFNDTTNYYIKHSSTGLYNKTNDRSAYVFNNAFRFSVYKKSVSFNTNNSWIYGKQQHQLSNNDIASTVDVDLFKNERKIYYWALLNYEKSYSLKINHRVQGGAGVGYYLLDQHNYVVQVSDGVLYETSDLYQQEGVSDNDYHTYRNSLRLKFRFIFKDVITLEGVDFLQHSFSDKHDYIIRSNTMLSTKVWRWISFTVTVNYNKLNLTGRENFLLNYGITAEKYF